MSDVLNLITAVLGLVAGVLALFGAWPFKKTSNSSAENLKKNGNSAAATFEELVFPFAKLFQKN